MFQMPSNCKRTTNKAEWSKETLVSLQGKGNYQRNSSQRQRKKKKKLLKEFQYSSKADLRDIDLCDDDEFHDSETDKENCFVCDDFTWDVGTSFVLWMGHSCVIFP